MHLRVGVAQVNTTVGDLRANKEKIFEYACRAETEHCDLVCFPELVLCGYPPEDLLLKPAFIHDLECTLEELAEDVGKACPGLVMILGTVHNHVDLFNAAAVCVRGEVAAYYHKRYLPNYGVFDEKRYFAAGTDAGPLLQLNNVLVGVTICEDAWVPGGPLLDQARAGAQLIVNINGSPFAMGKEATRHSTMSTRANDCAASLVYVNLVGGQDELVFDGGSLLFDAEGRLRASAARFEECFVAWDINCVEGFRQRLRESRLRGHAPISLPIVDLDAGSTDRTSSPYLRTSQQKTLQIQPRVLAPSLSEEEEVYKALVLGVRDYLWKNDFSKVVIGLSGGVDSSLTAAVAVDALGSESVVGIGMPSPYSSDHSLVDAELLAQNFSMEFHTVRIDDVFASMLQTMDGLFAETEANVAEENIQARIRGMILMGYSNKFGALLLTTGNKSELATGYCTLYGDMAGGYAVIKDVPKTLVYDLCRWRNEEAGKPLIPDSVLTKPPSAELRPDQLDSDFLPPYDVLDCIIEAFVERDMVASEIIDAGIGTREDVELVGHLLEKTEYKRRQAPPGVRIRPKAFGRDRRLPITNRYRSL